MRLARNGLLGSAVASFMSASLPDSEEWWPALMVGAMLVYKSILIHFSWVCFLLTNYRRVYSPHQRRRGRRLTMSTGCSRIRRLRATPR